ncbi:ABC transporter substrate-binding protein [Paenibacillus cremeus]|uniref:ABC transporter substrate-binding protein n=1 Tax=Paenibacillus cremeus TaxID=2163881 RepID=A0A559KGJ8_9BACL|nr:ABC transporter substrate-binding protein [Paenibacillus cremeus]TVY11246.1 ABC transporter substrate-binding protein [Paenibacillus cremeus]
MKKSLFTGSLTLLMVLSAVLAGCSSTEKPAASQGADQPAAGQSTEKKLVPVTQVTNWFAEPEHGGQYAALAKGYYKDAGLDMTIQSGGPQVSHIQIVASGKAQFGMAQADEILLARDQGIPVVALAAIFQKTPQAIMFHKGEPIKTFSDLNGRVSIIASGAAYWEYIKKANKLDKVKEMAYTGQMGPFVSDNTAVIQSYITSEPFTMKKQNMDIDFLMVHDSGYQPYAGVLFTTEKYLKENPDIVKAYIQASMKGWSYYKTNYEEINPNIGKANPDLSKEWMTFGAEAEMPLIFIGDAEKGGVGTMTKERWSTLSSQLFEIGLLKKQEPIEQAFTTQFVSGK